MSALGKIFQGSARSPKCKSCGEKVGVPKSAAVWEVLILAPPVAWVVLSKYAVVPIIVTVAAGVVVTAVHCAKVPLVKR